MDALKLYDDVASECAKRTTKAYSTSFSLGIRFLAPSLREAIYNIYGFVRYADEIVDTLHGEQQAEMFSRFKDDTYWALDHGMSSNPILHAFAKSFVKYNIDREHVDLFLRSMEWDLDRIDAYCHKMKPDVLIIDQADKVGVSGQYNATHERLRELYRRLRELQQNGKNVSYDEVLENVLERDRIDSERAVAPLRQADDAVVVDNSELTVEEQFNFLVTLARTRMEELG